MLSRLVSSTLEKLSIRESPSPKSLEPLCPTLSFPPPPPAGRGTRSLCARCLTLLSHVITQYGDGTGYKDLVILHSPSIPDPSKVSQGNASRNAHLSGAAASDISNVLPKCVVCTKTLVLFNAVKAHVSFEPSLRNTPSHEWSLSWRIDAPSPEMYPQFAFPHDSVRVLMSIKHKGGYGWGIGGFQVYPDWSTTATRNIRQEENKGDYPVIVVLDPSEGAAGDKDTNSSELGFSSTLGMESLKMISSWARECVTSHPKCHKIFGSKGLSQPVTAWFPDRLIRIARTETTETDRPMATVTARVVQKSNPTDFPPDGATAEMNYISLSHCWGPAPDPSAELGGRATIVLTESNLSAWQKDLPIDDLPLTFQHAIMVCAALGFEYIWIDSLCILQDSLEDWQTQSAVMGDVYKYAWLNVAALSAASDYDGFISESRDARVEFGFRAPFASILGRDREEKNGDGQECVLLRGRAKLLWNFSADLPGSNASNAALFTRAWVYQERSLARRTLAFAGNNVYWSCDEFSKGERPDWGGAGLESSGLRGTLLSVLDTAAALAASRSTGNVVVPGQRTIPQERLRSLINGFDMRWHSCVTSYTLCNLTKHTDKLIAISSVARELANSQIVNKRYLAGLWDVNLPFQMAWITVKGQTTPARKRVGEAGYVAPSWSWASIEAPVQPHFIFNSGNNLIALADVRAADVALVTDYAFGSVKTGWLRVWGRLNRVKVAKRGSYYSWDKGTKSTKLTDETTGEELWFCADTVECSELVESGKGIDKLVWMPLTLQFNTKMVECHCLCLIEVQAEDRVRSGDGFVKTGEKVYRRLGTGNFGRLASMLRQDRLLMGLGTYPDIQVQDGQGQQLAKGFKRKEDSLEEFVLV